MRIKIIPLEAPFLPALAGYVLKKHSHLLPDLSSIFVVFPSRRNKYYFRHWLLKKWGKGGLIPPTLFTIEEFFSFLFEKMGGSPLHILTLVERNALLKGIINSLKTTYLENIPFLRFLSLGNRFLKFFDELVREKKTLEEVEEKKEVLHFPERYVKEELPIFKEIQRRYQEILKKKGKLDPALRDSLVEENFKPELLQEFSFGYFAGFISSPRVETLLLKKILTQFPSELILHSEKKNLREEKVESPFYHHHKLLKSLGFSWEKVKIIGEEKTLSPSLFIKKVGEEWEEISFILEVLSRTLRHYPPHRVGIVLPDESLYLPLTASLERFSLPYNVSLGIPFPHTPLFSLLNLLLKVKQSQFHYKDFLSLIKHPFLKGARGGEEEFRPQVYKIEEKIRKNNLSRVDPSFSFLGEGRKDQKEFLQFLHTLFQIVEKDIPFPGWLRNLRHTLEDLLRRNETGLKERGTKEFLEKIEELENLSLPEEFFSSPLDKLEFILKIMEEETYPSFGDPFEGVQVIGVLEARNLDFDCVIIPRLNEGFFPRRSEKDLFIPFELRKEIGLPYYKERESLYGYYFEELIQGKREVWLLFREGEEEEVRSRFIERLLSQRVEIKVDEKWVPPFIFPRKKISPFRPRERIEKSPALRKKLSEFVFSPSSLTCYRICPYRFYLAYILELREPRLVEEEVTPRSWGNIIHSALDRFYGVDFPQGYGEGEKEEAKEKLFLRVEEAFKKHFPFPKPSNLLDLELWKRRLETLVEVEVERFKDGFIPYQEEEPMEVIELPVGKERVFLGGRPDRVDRKGEKYYILDYKTGKEPEPKKYRLGENFQEFQLPLYGFTLTQRNSPVGGLIYFHLDPTGSRFKYKDIFEPEYLERFKTMILLPTLEEILDQTIPFSRTEDLEKCRNCGYLDYCRREPQ